MNTWEDHALSSVPTAEWQDCLAARLSKNAEVPRGSCNQQSPLRAFGGAPLSQRRRLDGSSSEAGPNHPNWNEMYTMEASSGDSIILTVSSIQLNSSVFQIRKSRMNPTVRLRLASYRWTKIKKYAALKLML